MLCCAPPLYCMQADLSEFKQSEALTAQQRRERNLAHRLFLEKQIVEVSAHEPEGVAYTAAVLQGVCMRHRQQGAIEARPPWVCVDSSRLLCGTWSITVTV